MDAGTAESFLVINCERRKLWSSTRSNLTTAESMNAVRHFILMIRDVRTFINPCLLPQHDFINRNAFKSKRRVWKRIQIEIFMAIISHSSLRPTNGSDLCQFMGELGWQQRNFRRIVRNGIQQHKHLLLLSCSHKLRCCATHTCKRLMSTFHWICWWMELQRL